MNTSARLLFLTTLLTLSPVLATTARGLYQGTIIDWPAGQTGEVRLEVDVAADIARGPIDATGHFSLMLPAPSDVPGLFRQKVPGAGALPSLDGAFLTKSNFGPDCHGEGKATPYGAHFQWLTLNAYVDGTLLGDLQLTNSGLQPRPVGTISSQFLFLDTPVVMDGTVLCPFIADQIHGTFPAGWNLPFAQTIPALSANIESEAISSKALPARLPWRLYVEFGGTGLRFDPPADGQHGLPVNLVVPGQPAAAAGLLEGDIIVEVDGRNVIGLSMTEMVGLIRGPAGVPVILGVMRGEKSEIQRFTVTRALVRVP